MKSLAPKDYHLLPKLDAPAGYIFVLRDIDRDAYRFDSADHPATYLETLLAEMTGSFGIELIAILETDDIVASESQLFDVHHARLSDEWIKLDSHQLSELRQSDLQINAHGSLYLKPESEAAPTRAATTKSASRYNRPAGLYSRNSAERTRRRGSRASQAYREDEADAPRRRVRLDDIDGPYTLLQYIGARMQTLRDIEERLKETFLDYTLLWLFVAFVLVIVFMVLSLKYGPMISVLGW